MSRALMSFASGLILVGFYFFLAGGVPPPPLG
jgi:hypothetical protein